MEGALRDFPALLTTLLDCPVKERLGISWRSVVEGTFTAEDPGSILFGEENEIRCSENKDKKSFHSCVLSFISTELLTGSFVTSL